MTNENEKKSADVLKGMAQFIAEGHAMGAEEERLNDEIKAAGIDPVQFSEKFRGFTERAIQEELGKQRRTLREQRLRAQAYLEELHNKIAGILRKWNTQKDKDKETELLTRLDPGLAAVYHRNFKGASAADKASMMEDLELLEQLERIIRDGERM